MRFLQKLEDGYAFDPIEDGVSDDHSRAMNGRFGHAPGSDLLLSKWETGCEIATLGPRREEGSKCKEAPNEGPRIVAGRRLDALRARGHSP